MKRATIFSQMEVGAIRSEPRGCGMLKDVRRTRVAQDCRGMDGNKGIWSEVHKMEEGKNGRRKVDGMD